MIIKFDFGKINSIPTELVATMLNVVKDEAEAIGGAKLGGMSIYLQLYDSDGFNVDIVDASNSELKGKCVNYLVRKKPYVKKPSDKELFLTYCDRETKDPIAYIYKHYTN